MSNRLNVIIALYTVMNNLVFLMLAFVMMSGTNYAFAEQEYDYEIHPIEEYDLSDHPIFHPREFNSDSNFSSERYSPPAVSNWNLLVSMNVTYDPTIRSYVYATSTFDYCTLETFSKYPKCVEQVNQTKINKDNSHNLNKNYNSYVSENDVIQMFELAGVSYDSLPSWMKFNLEMWIVEDDVDYDEIMAAIEKFIESSSWN